MSDLTESQRGMIVVAHLVGASAATVANVMGVSKGTGSNVMRTYSMHGQMTSAKKNSGRKTQFCQIGTGGSAIEFFICNHVQ
ncbi:hypothetical protein C0J52_11711 [Blattella germanica]|nr:hypothetical protein C0J52_11711 [Blattella germanica]